MTTIFSGDERDWCCGRCRVSPDAGTLVALRPARRDGSDAEQGSYAFYDYLRERTRTLAGVAAWGRVVADDRGPAARAPSSRPMVSGNYFDVLGVRPALGRFFVADEHRTPASHPVIVVSHAFWTARMGGGSPGPSDGRSR